MKFSLLFGGLLVLAAQTVLFADPPVAETSSGLKNTVILIIRHAEKPESGSGLSADGVARAQAQVNYFRNFTNTIDGQPLKFSYLFAAADSPQSQRSRLTIEPTSRAFGLAVDNRFKDRDVFGLANEIRLKPHGPAILIVWHHGQIPALVRALGAEPAKILPKSKWPDDVFGWVIELRYDADGRLVETKRFNQKLLPGDDRLPPEK